MSEIGGIKAEKGREYFFGNNFYPCELVKILYINKKKNTTMKAPNIQIKEIPNKIFLSELQSRLRDNKIKDNQLAKILSELIFASNDEKELSAAYEE